MTLWTLLKKALGTKETPTYHNTDQLIDEFTRPSPKNLARLLALPILSMYIWEYFYGPFEWKIQLLAIIVFISILVFAAKTVSKL